MLTGDRKPRRVYAARVPAQQRRTELLDAALHLVVTAGHSAVTMDAVAEAVGVSKPVVYGVFAGRAALLGALLHREQEQALAQLAEVLPERPRATELGALLASFLDAVRAAPERWFCIVMPMPDMPVALHAAREQARDAMIARAERIAAAALLASGAPPELAPDIVAHTVVTVFEAAARLVLTRPEHYSPERFAAALSGAVGWVAR